MNHEETVARAQGIVSLQAMCSMEVALTLMQNAAAETDETLEQLAAQVVEGDLRFD